MPFEDVAGHVFGRRHVFQRRVGEDLARELRLRDLEEKAVLEVGIDFVGVAQDRSGVGHAGAMRELFVDELRREHGRRLFHRIGGREIVVFAGVDDDAGVRIEHAAEVLVDERPLMLMSRNRMPYIESLSSMSSRSSAAIAAISGMHSPLA